MGKESVKKANDWLKKSGTPYYIGSTFNSESLKIRKQLEEIARKE